MFLPIVDVSEHQGVINFDTMKTEGVHGVILRICHGMVLDVRFWRNWEEATRVFPGNVGIYPFINPKRGGAAETAMWMVNQIAHIDVPFIMLDIESYQNETPNKGVIWPASQNAEWLRTHVATLRRLVPNIVLIGYSNASYWNVHIQDPQLAADLEWIVPRYPVYSPTGYLLYPVPEPSLWDEWAFRRAPTGPTPPKGATGWEGWQFSAGHNRQGHRYGCQSTDLDLNIVVDTHWNKWTQTQVEPPPPPPPDEEDMKAILYTVTAPDGQFSWFYVAPDRTVGQVRNGREYEDWKTAGAVEQNAESRDHFLEMLTTFQPVGTLGTTGQAVLGDIGTADWFARNKVQVNVQVPEFEIQHLNFSGTITS